MCDFLDMNGVALKPGDEVEHWGSEKVWILSNVVSVETLSDISTRYLDDDYNKPEQYIRTKTSIKILPIDGKNPTRPYRSYGIKLKSGKNVRKV